MKKAVLVLLAIFLISGYSFSQNKYYIPSEDAYFKIEFEDDNRNNVEEYAGLYEYVYPGFLETMEYAGDGMYEGITLNFDNGGLFIKFIRDVEGLESESFNKHMLTPEIADNKLTFVYTGEDTKKFEGKFVKGKYKSKNNREITIFGLLRKEIIYGTSDYFYNFYVKKGH